MKLWLSSFSNVFFLSNTKKGLQSSKSNIRMRTLTLLNQKIVNHCYNILFYFVFHTSCWLPLICFPNSKNKCFRANSVNTEVADKSRRHEKPSANGFGWAYDKRHRPNLGPYHAFSTALNLFVDQQNKSSLQTSLAMSGKRGNFESMTSSRRFTAPQLWLKTPKTSFSRDAFMIIHKKHAHFKGTLS